MKKTSPRIMSIDIETAPISGYVWSLWQQNVGLNQINGEWCILSYCAKWLGDDNSKIIYQDNSKRRNKLDDSRLVKGLWKLLDEADIIIAHNGKRFDSKKIQARMFLQGFPPPSPYKIIDTLIETRRVFAMTSAKLEYLTDKMCTTKKSKHKQFPGFELWTACMSGNPAAWAEMKAYNIDDVISMEEYYILLRPWISGHPNVANYTEVAAAGPVCPNCASTHVIRKGTRSTQVGQYPRYHCQGCGAWSRGRLISNSKEHRKNLLVN